MFIVSISVLLRPVLMRGGAWSEGTTTSLLASYTLQNADLLLRGQLAGHTANCSFYLNSVVAVYPEMIAETNKSTVNLEVNSMAAILPSNC